MSRGKFIILVAGLCWVSSLRAEDVKVEFGFQEFAWSDPTTLEFLTEPIGIQGNSWGNEDQTDFYVETGSQADAIDAFIPGTQLVREGDIIVAKFESRFLTNANNHSYLTFGSDTDLGNAVFVGHGGGNFHVGTGTEFELNGAIPAGVKPLASFASSDAIGDGTISNDSRVGVRVGFDVANLEIRNFQVDSNNDGFFNLEFIEDGAEIATPDLSPLDWFYITYAGAGESRADNVVVVQQAAGSDYNEDLNFDSKDANVLCSQGIIGQDSAFDYNGDGSVDLEDINAFAFDNQALPADMDFNGKVEFADFLVLSGNFGQLGTYEEGDVSCNGRVDFADFLLVSTFFGSETNAQSVNGNALHAVPEPSALTHGLAAALFLSLTILRQTRKRHA